MKWGEAVSNIVCYDSDGKVLDHYTQWDVDQKLIIRGADGSVAPLIHFSNHSLKDSIIVPSSIRGGGIEVDVPNVLLHYPDPIVVYLYYKSGDSGTSKYSTRIPVKPKKRPSEYSINDGSGGILLDSDMIIVNDNKPDIQSVLWFDTSVI